MHILTYPMLTQFRSAMHSASIPYMANMQMFFLTSGIPSSSAISLHIGTEDISDEVIDRNSSFLNEPNSWMTNSLWALGDTGVSQIFLTSRNLLSAVMFNSLVSIFMLFQVWSKLQKYNKDLPERNAPADKSLMSNFFILVE